MRWIGAVMLFSSYGLEQLYSSRPLACGALSLSGSIAFCLLTGRLAMPPSMRARFKPNRSLVRFLGDQALRCLVISLVYALFFAISWRPIYSLAGTISVFAIFGAISRVKISFIREPLVFSDVALVLDVFRHKDIFYATWANSLFFVFAGFYVFGLSTLFYVFEPTLLPGRNGWAWAMAGIVPYAGFCLLLLSAPLRRMLARAARVCVGDRHLARDMLRFGTFEHVVLSFLIWLGRAEQPSSNEAVRGWGNAFDALLHAGGGEGALVVVWQSESFMDLRRAGRSDLQLPALDGLRQRAALWGRLGSIFEGGYTLRTEFSVLSGLRPDQIGLDASHPYLRAEEHGAGAFPRRVREGGWRTHFLHPYDRTFFMRHRAMPALGFETVTMLDAFDHRATPAHPYVSDLDLTRRVLQEIASLPANQPALFFAASMGNHGPWPAGRGGHAGDAISIYCSLLRDADAALGVLAAELDALKRPVWLVFYGDHAPLLKSFADPFPDPDTDYVIVPLGKVRRGTGAAQQRLEPWELLDCLTECTAQEAAARRQTVPRFGASAVA